MIRLLGCAALLASITVFPALAQQLPPVDLDQQATTLFETSYRNHCDSIDFAGDLPAPRMEKFEFSYVPTYDAELGARTIPVYRFFCNFGSYYTNHVYFWWREFEGLQPLLFAKPTYNAIFETQDDPTSKLLSIEVTGFTAQALMSNSEVDVLAGTISEEHLEGAMGDARHGTWVLDANGDFRLIKFSIDPGDDGGIENPVTVLEYSRP